MATYSIDDGHGSQLTTGLQEQEARTDALRSESAWAEARHEASRATGHQSGCTCIECGLIREESVYALLLRTLRHRASIRDSREGVAMATAYRIQIDEETGSDEVWDALHEYAAAHPAPEALEPYVGNHGWPNDTVVSSAVGRVAIAWLAAAARALEWDERTTPVLVIECEPEGLDAAP